MLLIQLARDDAGDQESRDHEENIDADKAARHGLREGVEAHDQQHRDRAQAINVRPISI